MAAVVPSRCAQLQMPQKQLLLKHIQIHNEVKEEIEARYWLEDCAKSRCM
jgi:hypothetical protein